MKVSVRSWLALALVVVAGAALVAQSGHVMQTAAELKWGPAPPFIPAGAQIAVLSGDPSKPAPYTVQLKFPANYTVMPHSHPTDENVAILSGELFMGTGDKLNKPSAKAMGPGGYSLVPANSSHFVYTKAATTILLYGTGPVEFKYVNPADDPRNKK